MDLQMPYMKYKLTNALKFAVFKNPILIVDNLELHFGGHPTFYSKWFYLRYLNWNSNNKNLIIDMPWNSIKDIFEYFSTSYNDKFAFTFTTKINQSENYQNFLPKIIPINSLILSSLPRDTLLSALKFSNIFSLKKLEIVQSRLSKKELNFLKTLELESILLNLGVYQSYDSIDFVLDAVQGIPDIW